MKIKKVLLLGIPSFLLAFALAALWDNPVTRPYFDSDYWSAIGKFGESLRLTQARYVKKEAVGYDALVDAALEGMTENLDRHSAYYPPPDYEVFQNDTKRQYYGIGVAIRKVEAGVLVMRVFPGGPAQAAGVRQGEFIAKVERESVEEWTLQEVTKRIKGEEGSSVLVGLRDLEGSERELEVERGRIQMASVEEVRVDDNGTGYLRIEQFTARTAEELRGALKRLDAAGVKRLALDLRGNAGGLLAAAVEVAGEFLPDGQVVVSAKGREGFRERVFKVEREGEPRQYPLVVLVDEGSASASEIVAGALGVTGRAKLVGEKTYGKGSVQTVFTLDDESGLRLTTAMYYLPDGSTIHERGIEPDHPVECDDETEGKLRIQRYRRPFEDPDAFEALFGFAPVRDEQLKFANDLLQGKSPQETAAPRPVVADANVTLAEPPSGSP